jgi:hypothetical protein
MPPTATRIVGSGFTVFQWSAKAIAFLDEIHDSGQAPIRQYEAVTPLGDYYPREFALPRVKSEGTLQFIIREMWDQPAWWGFTQFLNTYNIIDIYNIQSGLARPIICSTIIKQPNGSTAKDRGWSYLNCNLITIDDREVVQIGALTMPRTITAVYANKLYFPSPEAFSGGAPPVAKPALPANNNQAGGSGDKQFAKVYPT